VNGSNQEQGSGSFGLAYLAVASVLGWVPDVFGFLVIVFCLKPLRNIFMYPPPPSSIL
jgi:hypothetical protein